MSKKRRIYSKEFKEDAVNLYLSSGKSYYEVEDELGIPRGSICKWRRDSKSSKKSLSKQESDEIKRLKKENAELRLERDILKKAAAIFSQDGK